MIVRRPQPGPHLVKCTDCKFAVPRKTCYRNGKNRRGEKRPPAKYSSIKRACIGFEAIEMNTDRQPTINFKILRELKS